jgi:hypothetical protein
MSADEAARQVLRHFEAFDPVATLIFDRDGGVRTLRSIEFSIIPAVLSDADFGVCEVSSSNVGQGPRATHYKGRYDLRDNRKICIAVANQGAGLLLLPISLTERGWEWATPSLKRKAAEAHRVDELGKQLYPLVARVDTHLAGKITGMLLEMPDASVRLLLSDEQALKERIDEAVRVLQQAGWDGREGTAAAGTAADAASAADTGASADPAAGVAGAAGVEGTGPEQTGPWRLVKQGGRGRGSHRQGPRNTVGTRNDFGALPSRAVEADARDGPLTLDTAEAQRKEQERAGAVQMGGTEPVEAPTGGAPAGSRVAVAALPAAVVAGAAVAAAAVAGPAASASLRVPQQAMAVAEAAAVAASGAAAKPTEAEPGVVVSAAAAAVTAAKTSPNGKHLSPQQRTQLKRAQAQQQWRQRLPQPTDAPVATTPATEAAADSGVAAAPAGAAGDVTAGAAVAATDAATTGAAEAAAARPGPEKRHIDEVTPGEVLGTRTRAREWAASDSDDDSSLSDLEEEDSSEEEDDVKEKTAEDKRAKWVHDVARLRRADLTDLKMQNDASYASVFGQFGQPGSSMCVSIFPQEQSRKGVLRFAHRGPVRALLRRLPFVDKEHYRTVLPCGKTVHSLSMAFATKSEAWAARARILEEHKGGDWPPFVVAFAVPSVSRCMEQLAETRTPGAAK